MSHSAAVTPNKVPPPAVYHDESDDSDNESDDGVTNVQLGLSDGQVEGDDESNPLISRIGGRPAWLPTQVVPPASIADCKYCNTPMELLVQIFAPLEKSPYDRTLLAWGCARPACQRKGQGSLRVIRHLQYNARWAARLEKQKQKKAAREERKKQQAEHARARKAEEEAKSKINPFSTTSTVSSDGIGGGLFGGGFGSSGNTANPFASSQTSTPAPAQAAPPTSASDSEESDSDSEDSIDEEAEEAERLADELAMKTAVKDASSTQSSNDAWASKTTSYRPSLYLSTVPEASSSKRAGDDAVKAKLRKKGNGHAGSDSDDDDVDDDDDDDDDNDADLKGFAKEGYEKMMLAGMDDVLEKFIARVGAEGRQVVRYELGGQPLPFSAQGEVYKHLWPQQGATVGGATAISRAQHSVNGTPHSMASSHRRFDSSKIPLCEVCGSKRTFEFQLMPNLVNTLRAEQIYSGSAEHDETPSSAVAAAAKDEDATTRKRRELEAVLGKTLAAQPSADGITRTNTTTSSAPLSNKTGLCWSTAMVFVCEKDCCIPPDAQQGAKEGETWREEWVALQFED